MIWLSLIFILSSCISGVLWAVYQLLQLSKIQINNEFQTSSLVQQQIHLHSVQKSVHFNSVQIGRIIEEGATEFIVSEYKVCGFFVLCMALIVLICVDEGQNAFTSFAFVVGAFTSMFCGATGMKIATYANYRTTICAKQSLGFAFKTAFRAGSMMGFILVSTSLFVLLLLILIYKTIMGLDDKSTQNNYYQALFQAIAGYGLGGSTVALFARVGGGIFTKAADLGSDLVGKIQIGLPQDSPRNPATIADNVGDNVGDIAGMGADLFGSFAQASCAALIIGSNSIVDLNNQLHFSSFLFVLMIPSIGILVCICISSLITEGSQIKQAKQVEGCLKKQLIFSTIGLLPFLFILTSRYFQKFIYITNKGVRHERQSLDVFICVGTGLIAGFIIVYFTQIMTSFTYKPVIQLAQSCKTGAATNIIYGLSLGYFSTIVPVFILCLVCYYSHSSLGYYGVALSALGMLSNLPICLAIDGYGPISDNAGGIAQMAQCHKEVRQRTDILDAAGNTTAAIGKGFAIGSATLVGFALYGAFYHRVNASQKFDYSDVSFDNPLIFTSLLFGSMIPYVFSALTMKSVGKAALAMIYQVRKQITANPGILNGSSCPDYKACIRVSTQSSLKQMILPGLLVTLTPFTLGYFFGPKSLLGFLPGAIVSGVQMAISASNTGGAWDNAKKYIQAGLMKDQQGKIVKKGSEIHKAAVIGDSVGDPLKDTSGPSLNILIKLMAILSLVFCKYFSS